MVAKNKILIITVWFGEWPSYSSYFIKTLLKNPDFNWMLVANQSKLPDYTDNLQIKLLSISGFEKLASDQLGFPVQIRDPVKLCDFKPTFGRIFFEYLQDYDYWGYCDIDLILGNLSKFIPPLITDEPDVVSFYPGFLSGPFCLFRNNEKTINLYAEVPSHRSVLQSPEHHAFDENILSPGNPSSPLRMAGLKIRYLAGLPFNMSAERCSLAEIAYQFQWYAKQHIRVVGHPADMTELVFQEGSEGRLKARFEALLRSDREFSRLGRKDWRLTWEDGTLTDAGRRRELFGFHFSDLKNRKGFRVPDTEHQPDVFSLTGKGFEL